MISLTTHHLRLREGRDGSPNTSVIGFAGRTWALVEAGATPVEMSCELGTLGRNDFFGTLQAAFSAHTKLDPASGELHAMTYARPERTDLQYVVVGADALVRRTVDIPVADMVMGHDMSLTARYAIVYDLPVTLNMTLAMQQRFPFAWNDAHPARIGLLPREGAAADILWCAVQPCYAFHPLNAYDAADGGVVIDLCRYERMFVNDLRGPFGDSLPTLVRWTVDPATRRVSEETVDGRSHEFPRLDPRRVGREHRYGYTAGVDPASATLMGATYKTDYRSGVVTPHDHGPGRGGAEPVFVPREGSSAEDDGWLLVTVYDAGTDRSDLVVLDAADIAAPPVATVHLPRRVPHGFHGDWVSDEQVAPR